MSDELVESPLTLARAAFFYVAFWVGEPSRSGEPRRDALCLGTYLGGDLRVRLDEGEVLLERDSFHVQLAVLPLDGPYVRLDRPVDPSRFRSAGDAWTAPGTPLKGPIKTALERPDSPAGGPHERVWFFEQTLLNGEQIDLLCALAPAPKQGGYRGASPDRAHELVPASGAAPPIVFELPARQNGLGR